MTESRRSTLFMTADLLQRTVMRPARVAAAGSSDGSRPTGATRRNDRKRKDRQRAQKDARRANRAR